MLNPLLSGLLIVAVVLGLGSFLIIVSSPPVAQNWQLRIFLALISLGLAGVPAAVLWFTAG